MAAATKLTPTPLQASRQKSVEAFAPRKVIVVGVGTSGVEAAAYVKANELLEHGAVRPGLVFFALDVMPDPPTVFVEVEGAGPRPSKLDLQREYVPIGAGLDPPHLSHVLRGTANTDSALRWLLDRQPGGRFLKSLERGTEGERAYGLLAYIWSRAEIVRLIEALLRQLNDVRLPDGRGDWVADAPTDVFIIGSEAGGVGSASAMPLCGDIKRAMHRLGMPVHRSFFTYVVIGPEAYPEKTLRLSNTCEVLGDLAVAQLKGLVP